MALRMRHWVALALAGCGAVALRLLPPAELDVVREAPPQDVVYEHALRRDVARTNARLQRIRVAERVIQATLAAEGPLAFDVPANTDPEEVARVRADAVAEAQASRTRTGTAGGPDPALGLFYTLASEGAYPGAVLGYVSGAEYYVGVREGRPYCVAVVPSWFMRRNGVIRLEGVRAYASRIGVCGAVARYGLPGSAVRRWLGRGAAVMASSPTPSRLAPGAFSTAFGSTFDRRGSFGLPVTGGSWGWRLRNLAQEQCFAGVQEGCGRLLLEPAWTSSRWYYVYQRENPSELLATTPVAAASNPTLLEPADRHILADLADEFGHERVARWWRADGDPADAFRDAFGVDAGAWYADRVSRLVTISEPGPGIAPVGFLGALVIVTLGNLAAAVWAKRRRVA